MAKRTHQIHSNTELQLPKVLLALDASLNKQSVAVFKRGASGYELVEALEQQASSSQFMTLVAQLALKPEEITELAVITGPGSFTGLRTALTVAKTIAAARNIKIYPINNFELLRMDCFALRARNDQAIAIKLSDHDYYISLDTNYDNPETNFYSADLPQSCHCIEMDRHAASRLAMTTTPSLQGGEADEAIHLGRVGDFLNANPRKALVASELQPYYLRLPQIGKVGVSKVRTKTGLSLDVAANDLNRLLDEARLAMAETRFTDASQLTKLYISRRRKDIPVGVFELLAEAQLELSEFSNAKRHYLKVGNLTQAAFAALVAAKFDEARHLYLKAPDSIAQRWGLFLCDYLAPQHQAPISSPGFMAFRLFLESTVSYMLRAKAASYVETLLANYEKLETVFPELRKAIGSAYLGLQLYEKAAQILSSVKVKLSHDAELFYKLAEAQMGLGDRDAARESLEIVLKLLPGHIGSQNLLKSL